MNSSRPVGCALARSKTDVYPVTAYLMAASTCGESQQEEYMKEAALNGYKQIALDLAAHYVEVEEYSNASKFLNLASGSSCAPSVKPVERGFVDCNISLTKLDAVRRQLSEARSIKADADKRAREERLARQREARNSQLAIKNARHRQTQEAAIARKKEEKKAKRREFFGKLAGGLLKFTGQVLEAAVVGAITYKIADELDLDPRQTYYEPPRRNRQQGSQNLPSPRKDIIGNQSRPAQNYAPSCRCECVDGRKVSLCTSAVAVPAICAGYCPAAPKMYHPPSVAAPPPGTISCTNKSVYNEATVSYESRTVCE